VTAGDGKDPGIDVGEKDGVRVVTVRGEIDLASSPLLRTALLRTIAGSSGSVAVDLRDVKYMDSSGVATLVEGLRACSRKKIKLLLIAVSKPVRNVLQLTRLDSVFELRESL
jgi:anti-sigma B factor antagonist